MDNPQYHLLIDSKNTLATGGLLTLIDTYKGVFSYQTKHKFSNRKLLEILEGNMIARYKVIDSVIIEV